MLLHFHIYSSSGPRAQHSQVHGSDEAQSFVHMAACGTDALFPKSREPAVRTASLTERLWVRVSACARGGAAASGHTGAGSTQPAVSGPAAL